MVRELGILSPRYRSSGVTFAQVHVLLELERRGSASVQELADALAVEKSALSRTLSQLRRARWISMRTDSEDARRKCAALTARGRQRVAGIHRDADADVDGALADLTEPERETVIRGVELYARALLRRRSHSEATVRAVRSQDSPRLRRVLREWERELGKRAAADTPESGSLYLAMRDTGGAYLVAQRRGVVVGCAGYEPGPAGASDDAVISLLYVLPEARRLGLGRRLVEEMATRAAADRMSRLVAIGPAGRTESQEFLKRVGFVRARVSSSPGRGSGVSMVLKLRG